jgi:8-oxo-dGTP pyrophosphatase MutT (NUDIX family)
MNNPWKTKSSKQIYDSPWIGVRKDEVINPASKDAVYSVTEFKKWAIGIIPIDDHGNTWMVGQWRYPLKKYTWEIPEGGGDKTDTPLQSAKRELREETGIVAEHWDLILEMDLSNSATDEHAYIYIAKGLSFFESNPDEEEDLQIRKLPFKTLYQEVMDGKHQDSLTVGGVLKLACLNSKYNAL